MLDLLLQLATSLSIALFGKNDLELITVGSAAPRVDGFTFATFGFQMVDFTLFLAPGKEQEGGILSMSRQEIFFLPAILILLRLFGLRGITYAQLFADICTTRLQFYPFFTVK